MKFILTEDQVKKFNEWTKNWKLSQHSVGAIGGVWTYSFTPTSIGLVCKITNNMTGETVDVSDYENW